MTQDMDERARLNTSRSLAAMIAIGVINVITLPLVNAFGGKTSANAYLSVAILYGIIFAACHLFCFTHTRETVHAAAPKTRIPLAVQLKAVCRNKPYLAALLGQFLFGAVLYGRNADYLYYFKYVAGNEDIFTTFALVIVLPSIFGAVLFRPLFALTGNKGRAATILAFLTGLGMFAIYPFTPNASPVLFYTTAAPSGREKFQTSFVLTQTISSRGATGTDKPCCPIVVCRGALSVIGGVLVGAAGGLVEP